MEGRRPRAPPADGRATTNRPWACAWPRPSRPSPPVHIGRGDTVRASHPARVGHRRAEPSHVPRRRRLLDQHGAGRGQGAARAGHRRPGVGRPDRSRPPVIASCSAAATGSCCAPTWRASSSCGRRRCSRRRDRARRSRSPTSGSPGWPASTYPATSAWRDALRAAEIAREAGSGMALAWSWNFVALAKMLHRARSKRASGTWRTATGPPSRATITSRL